MAEFEHYAAHMAAVRKRPHLYERDLGGNLIDQEALAVVRVKLEAECTPTWPRPWRFQHPDKARDRSLANPYMEAIAADERQMRISNADFSPISEERKSTAIHRLLYHPFEHVPDGVCVCHYAAGLDVLAEHGRLCWGCEKYLRGGNTREHRVIALLEREHRGALEFSGREERQRRTEVSLGFDPTDGGKAIQASVAYRGDFGGHGSNTSAREELGRENEVGTDEDARLRASSKIGTPHHKWSLRWERRWVAATILGLRLPRSRRVRMRDGTTENVDATWTREDVRREEERKRVAKYEAAWRRRERRLEEIAEHYEVETALPEHSIIYGDAWTTHRITQFCELHAAAIPDRSGGTLERTTVVSINGPSAFTIPQVAEVLHLTQAEVREFIADGLLITHQVGSKPLVGSQDLADFISSMPRARGG